MPAAIIVFAKSALLEMSSTVCSCAWEMYVQVHKLHCCSDTLDLPGLKAGRVDVRGDHAMGSYLKGLSSAMERLTADEPEASQQQRGTVTPDAPPSPAGGSRAATDAHAAEHHAAAGSSPRRQQHAGARHSEHPSYDLDAGLDSLQEHALATAPASQNAIAPRTPDPKASPILFCPLYDSRRCPRECMALQFRSQLQQFIFVRSLCTAY